MPNSRRVALLLFAGSLLLQLAWIITLPPFRGIDEFDHAYRAAAVADGQWVAGRKVPDGDGRGNFVAVPRTLVEAARPECYTYEYTGYANCNPMRNLGGGYVTVASAAARYNPVFYWLVGTPAKFFHGAASLLIMRLAASLLCSAMIGAIGWILAQWAQTRWPLVGMLVGLTPMVVYGTSLPAPNGVEMLAGLGLWAALLGLTRVGGDPIRERRLLWAAAAMAIPLSLVRSLGPLWLGMIVLSVACFFGWRRGRDIVTRNGRAWALGASAVAAVALAGGVWSLASSTNSPSVEIYAHYRHALANSMPQLYLWVFQSFAAFPTRTEFPPLWIFPLGLIVFAMLLIVAARLGGGRDRMLILAIALASLAVPLLLTLATYSRVGAVWQGRYTLPYSLGLPLVASLVLERKHRQLQFARPTLIAGWVMYTAAQVEGILYVLFKEQAHSPLAGTGEWLAPPSWLVSGLAVCGMAAWALSGVAAERPADDRVGQAAEGHKRDRAPDLRWQLAQTGLDNDSTETMTRTFVSHPSA